MRPPPEALEDKNQSLVYPTISSTATSTSRWRPYSNSNDFEANAVLILIIIVCTLTCALALNAAIRCFLRGSGQQRSPQSDQQELEIVQREPNLEMVSAHKLVYSAEIMLARAEVECVICLSEFVEGDVIQVLGRCKHGFHVSCIQQWLSSKYSCPTCRCSCHPSSPSFQEITHQGINHYSQPD